MGLTNGSFVLSNPGRPDVPAVTVEALAEPALFHLCIPEHVRLQLQLEAIDSKPVILADGSRPLVPYVGSVQIRFKNRAGFTGALVMGQEVLVGAIPMENMDVVVIPKTRSIDANPLSPEAGTSRA